MPGYSSFRRRYPSTYRRRRAYRRAYRRYARRYPLTKPVNTSSRSRLTVRFPIHVNFTTTQAANARSTDVWLLNPLQCSEVAYPMSLLRLPSFRGYCGMYEEMKIDSVYIKISGVQPVGSGNYQAAKFVSAWCRHTGQTEVPWANGDEMYNSNTSKQRTFVQNNVVKQARAIYASDIQERTQFMSTAMSYSANRNAYYLTDYHDRTEPACFAPALGFAISVLPVQNAARTFEILIDCYVNVTFRNPHFGVEVSVGPSAKNAVGGSDAIALVSTRPAGATIADPTTDPDPETEDLDPDEMPESTSETKTK